MAEHGKHGYHIARYDRGGFGAPLPDKMAPCATCGHRWGDHARPPHIDADIDEKKIRWCFAVDSKGQCACTNYVMDSKLEGA